MLFGAKGEKKEIILRNHLRSPLMSNVIILLFKKLFHRFITYREQVKFLCIAQVERQ